MAAHGVKRGRTWQQDENEHVQQGPLPGDRSWTETGASLVVGVIPVAGPLANCGWNIHKKRYTAAAIDGALCVADVCTLGSASGAITGAKAAKVGTATLATKVANAAASLLGRETAEGAAMIAAEVAVKGATQRLAQRQAWIGGAKVAGWIAGVAGWIDNRAKFGEEHAAIAGSHIPGTAPGPVLTSDEAQGTCVLPPHKIPMRSLKASNYLMLYDQCPRCPSIEQIILPMVGLALLAFRDCLKKCHNRVGEATARLWSDVYIYQAMNVAIISDNAGLLRHWMGVIRALNNYLLRHHPTQRVTTRRKSFMTLGQAAGIIVGQHYRLGMYVATSKEEWVNMPAGVGGSEVRIEFDIPQGCFQVCDVEQIAVFSEKEMLIVPYSAVRIVDKSVDPITNVVTITMQVIKDGREMPLELDTILA